MIGLIVALGFIYADVYKGDGITSYAIWEGHTVGEKNKKYLTKVSSFRPPIVIPIKEKRIKSFEEKLEELERLMLERWLR